MEPNRVCTNCGGELDRVAPGAVLTTVKRLYCRRCREPEEGSLRAVLVSVSWWVVVLAAVFAVAWLLDARKPVQADSDLPRWAVVKWQHGVPLMATFEARSEAECKDIAAKRSAAYAHAGVEARWRCVDLATASDKQA